MNFARIADESARKLKEASTAGLVISGLPQNLEYHQTPYASGDIVHVGIDVKTRHDVQAILNTFTMWDTMYLHNGTHINVMAKSADDAEICGFYYYLTPEGKASVKFTANTIYGQRLDVTIYILEDDAKIETIPWTDDRGKVVFNRYQYLNLPRGNAQKYTSGDNKAPCYIAVYWFESECDTFSEILEHAVMDIL